MTKLLEWICGLVIYLTVWLVLVWKKEHFVDELDYVIYFLPVFNVIAFGMYSLAVVLWRVYQFNDCPEAAKELQEQILEARKDLSSKGLKF